MSARHNNHTVAGIRGMRCSFCGTPIGKAPAGLLISFRGRFAQEGPAETVLDGEVATDLPGISKVPLKVMPDFPCRHVDAVLRDLELLSISASARQKNINERVTGLRASPSNAAIKGADNRTISAAIVVFNFGVGAVEGAQLVDVVSGNLR